MIIDTEGVELVLQSLSADDRENRAFTAGGEVNESNLLPSLSVSGTEEIGVPISAKVFSY